MKESIGRKKKKKTKYCSIILGIFDERIKEAVWTHS